MASELEPCPFCSKTMMLRSALWPSEGDADAIIHADPTDCPMLGFSDGSADGSIIEKWNCSLSNEDDFPSDGSCVRCGSVPRNANGLCNTCLDEDAERLENTRTTPVAPVSPDTDGKCGELVTVAKQHRLIRGGYPGSWQPYASPIFSDDVFETRELVTRSQAEELLAAERAKTERWHKKAMDAGVITHSDGTTSHPMRKELDDLKADNAAQAARIKELEGINANLMGDDEDKPRYTTKRLKHEIARATEALEAKIASKDGWKELHDAAQVAVKERTEACNSLYKQVATLEAKIAAAEKALEPFSKFAGAVFERNFNNADVIFEISASDGGVLELTGKDFFEARAVRGGKPS
ncbi:hypothetical protein [Brucella intermedia]|uniref:hypothetical protein n=1 Tax=Brucella intermedia TaxID=94625 RepID=UPI00244EC37A|nr:hypothetical protein [Brucella intermedia]WGJ07467.1 hypothetical protein QBQ48_04200 [Brucella intermedia]